MCRLRFVNRKICCKAEIALRGDGCWGMVEGMVGVETALYLLLIWFKRAGYC
jgi:hypothetical protein